MDQSWEEYNEELNPWNPNMIDDFVEEYGFDEYVNNQIIEGGTFEEWLEEASWLEPLFDKYADEKDWYLFLGTHKEHYHHIALRNILRNNKIGTL